MDKREAALAQALPAAVRIFLARDPYVWLWIRVESRAALIETIGFLRTHGVLRAASMRQTMRRRQWLAS